MTEVEKEVRISDKKIRTILNDVQKTARAIHLEYVHDDQPGIKRIRKGELFVYVWKGRQVKDKETLQRIRNLVLPPAWEDVWICSKENGHLQATGFDVKRRKQYKYHAFWNALRNHTKFYRLHEFGKTIPEIRRQLQKDMSLPGLPLEKVLATVVSLMEQTSIRVGNEMYERLYGSYGLTTLKDKHVKIRGAQIRFLFKGKKGVLHNISLKSKRLAHIVKKCQDIPGQELFQYMDEHGHHHAIDSGQVNQYLKTITGTDFTAKDFRTWSGSVLALEAFGEAEVCETISGIKKNIVAVLDKVASHLGNTRTVCKKYYVHPLLIALYENKRLHTYLRETIPVGKKNEVLSDGEKLLLRILEKETKTTLTIQ